MNELLTHIVYVLIIGGIAGYFIGNVVKKLSYMALPLGVFAFLLIYLAYTKAVNLNFEEFGATINKVVDALTPLGFTALVSSSPFIGSFVVGLFLGLKRG